MSIPASKPYKSKHPLNTEQKIKIRLKPLKFCRLGRAIAKPNTGSESLAIIGL